LSEQVVVSPVVVSPAVVSPVVVFFSLERVKHFSASAK